MDERVVEKAVRKADLLLRNIEEPLKSQAFPVVLHYLLAPDDKDEVPATRRRPKQAGREKDMGGKRGAEKPSRAQALRKMISSGWFKRRRKLGDIAKELKVRGFSIKTTSLPSLLLPLVIDSKLKRNIVKDGNRETFVYFT